MVSLFTLRAVDMSLEARANQAKALINLQSGIICLAGCNGKALRLDQTNHTV